MQPWQRIDEARNRELADRIGVDFGEIFVVNGTRIYNNHAFPFYYKVTPLNGIMYAEYPYVKQLDWAFCEPPLYDAIIWGVQITKLCDMSEEEFKERGLW